MRVAIGSDHAGYLLKETLVACLIEAGIALLDGTTRADATMGGFAFSQTTTSQQWVRLSDGALIRKETHTNVTAPNGAGGTGTEKNDTSTVYDAPCLQFHYPMRSGDTWSTICTSSTTTKTSSSGERRSNETTTFIVSALRDERVSVPAGAFDALVLNVTTNGKSEMQWYAPQVCSNVKTIAEGNLKAELTAYRCAAGSSQASATTTTPTLKTPSLDVSLVLMMCATGALLLAARGKKAT